MIKLDEVFPVEALGPVAGGAILWFAANWLFLAPDVIAPRLAAKYYVPACLTAVQDGRQAHGQRRQTLIEQGNAQIQATMQQVQQQMQAQTGNAFGMLFGGRPGSAEFMQRHGATLNNWANSQTAPFLQQRFQQEQAALNRRIQDHEREARNGTIHAQPAAFCRCVVAEGFKDRIDLAAFTATLRLYTPQSVSRLKDGTIIHEVPACGKPPIV